MNKYECDVLDDKKIKQLALTKLLNIQNIVGVLSVIIFAVIIIGSFNNNVLKTSDSLLRKQEVKNALLLLILAIIVESVFIIIIYKNIKKYFKIITGNYKCILTHVIKKEEEHSEERYNDGTVQGHSSYYLDLYGIEKLITVSIEEYNSLNENDKCYAILVENNTLEEIKVKNILLVIKAKEYIGKNQVITTLQ